MSIVHVGDHAGSLRFPISQRLGVIPSLYARFQEDGIYERIRVQIHVVGFPHAVRRLVVETIFVFSDRDLDLIDVDRGDQPQYFPIC